ncbi:MAG: CoA transferase [bacterium]
MTAALADVVILELASEPWSALASVFLADFGADVIRIDDRAATVPRRADDAPPSDLPGWDPESELVHRNKRALAVDLARPEGRALLHDLVRTADVFLTDWPARELAAYGLDAESLGALNPKLIYARGTGFGPKGPDAELPALDELAAARTGMMPILQQPGKPPVYAGHGAMYTATMLGFGIVTALIHRDASGEGQTVDASLYAGNMYGASLDVQAFLAMGGERFLHPVSRLDAGNPMSGTVYPAKDGRWVTLTMPDTDRWWPAFSELVGLDRHDPRFDTHEKRCGVSRLEMMRVLEERFATRDADHWKRGFDAKQLSADIIEDYSFPASDPDARKNRYVLDLDRPGVGSVATLGFPIFASESPARLRSLAPCTGQHTDQVLRERLGLDERRIAELRLGGIIGS